MPDVGGEARTDGPPGEATAAAGGGGRGLRLLVLVSGLTAAPGRQRVTVNQHRPTSAGQDRWPVRLRRWCYSGAERAVSGGGRPRCSVRECVERVLYSDPLCV